MKKGFTLAEVLITLGIIGIVAAMTIPTLVANYQQKSWSTSASVFERKLEEALKVMNTQQTLAGYTTTEAFVEELGKHIKIVKTCNNNKLENCFPMDLTWEVVDIETGAKVSDPANLFDKKTASDFGKDWGTNIVGIQFANGTSGLIAYDPDCKQDPYSNRVTGTSCIALLYDTSGFAKPNSINKDLRSMGAVIKGNCAFKAGSTCFQAPFAANSPMSLADCEAQKSALGIDACYYDGDYWAGAVAVCGGTTKMATLADAAKIASYIYDINGLGTYDNIDYSTGVFNKDRAAELGLLSFLELDSYLHIVSGVDLGTDAEYPDEVYFRYMNEVESSVHARPRSREMFLAICKGQ